MVAKRAVSKTSPKAWRTWPGARVSGMARRLLRSRLIGSALGAGVQEREEWEVSIHSLSSGYGNLYSAIF
jgi:hypothetical protein